MNGKLRILRDLLFGKKSEKRNISNRYRRKLKKRTLLLAEQLAPPPQKEELNKLEELLSEHKLSVEELADIARAVWIS